MSLTLQLNVTQPEVKHRGKHHLIRVKTALREYQSRMNQCNICKG